MKVGKKAAYGEIDPESTDLMTINIGNIGPGEKVSIEVSYIEELALSLNTFYRFAFPVKNNPRYMNAIPDQQFRGALRNKVIIQGK